MSLQDVKIYNFNTVLMPILEYPKEHNSLKLLNSMDAFSSYVNTLDRMLENSSLSNFVTGKQIVNMFIDNLQYMTLSGSELTIKSNIVDYLLSLMKFECEGTDAYSISLFEYTTANYEDLQYSAVCIVQSVLLSLGNIDDYATDIYWDELIYFPPSLETYIMDYVERMFGCTSK